MSNSNGDSVHQITIPIAVGVLALLLGVGGTVFYFGGSLRQIDINTANIARLDPVGNSLLAMKTEFDNQRRAYDQLAAEMRSLPAADNDLRVTQAALKTQVAGIQLEINEIRRDFRPREYWEGTAAGLAMLKLQVGELLGVRDRAIPEWNALLQRVSSLEAHFNDAMARVNLLSSDVRDELNFWRSTAARRVDTPRVETPQK